MAEQLTAESSLAALLLQEGGVSEETALQVFARLAEELARMHAAGRLHREISCDTILVGPDNRVRLLADSASPVAIGGNETWGACPPELQIKQPLLVPALLDDAQRGFASWRQPCTPVRIDLYQFGCAFLRVIAGVPPSTYLMSPRTKSQLPSALRDVVDRALGYEADKRYNNAGELQAALQALSREREPAETNGQFRQQTTSARRLETVLSSQPVSQALEQPMASRGKPPLPFAYLGPYRVHEQIGCGGMGDVYRAYDFRLNRDVAIKVLPRELARQGNYIGRFIDEARAASSLDHPHIVSTYQVGEDQGCHYFVMQYVDGESLADLLEREKIVDLSRGLEILQQVLMALTEAHNRGLVHRDLKPGNILLEKKSGKALLADFGLVKSLNSSFQATSSGVLMGTVDYLSPEQGQGQAVDARADLYSLGVLAYQMFSGKLPFEAEGPASIIFQHAYKTPKPLSSRVDGALPPGLSAIVQCLLQKEPSKRYQTAEQLAEDIRAVQSGESPSYPKLANRGYRSALAAGILAVMLAAGAAFAPWTAGPRSHADRVRGDSKPKRAATSPRIPYSAGSSSGPESVEFLTSQGWQWTAPKNAGPAINSPWNENEPFLSEDGLTLLIRSDRPGGSGGYDLWMAQRGSINQSWGRPTNLGPGVNRRPNEGCPSMTADGLQLFFFSSHKLGKQDIYVSQRVNSDAPWGERRLLGSKINTPRNEGYPFILPDGLTLLFSAKRPGGVGNYDLWMSQRPTRGDEWGEATRLSQEINTFYADFAPKLCAGGKVLLFGLRGAHRGDNDLAIAVREDINSPFTKAVRLGPVIDTGYNESGAYLSADGKTLWFTSTRPGGQGGSDLWFSRRVPAASRE